ncbi:hypothetical protein [Caulobacter hibisci]|uniref:Uncharacterized protein n=1 Tax=Caulobacter hibisci TaxID=2035993 RepID=A0ABS0SVR4_9CAUL|nr:hypothetical protein [Caulobacter hibisci]MBI1683711.1 hypothetical protein [Caulobacter hibisci]
MLRLVFAVAALALPAAASAAPPTVSVVEVSIGPDLAAKADVLGAREFDFLSADLKRTVERRLAHKGALAAEGGRLTLVIEDAEPNRPTFRQLGAKPGLSLESFGVGGARISGDYVGPDGVRTPIRYSWYQTDIAQSAGKVTWTDAQIAFARLARRIGDGSLSRD